MTRRQQLKSRQSAAAEKCEPRGNCSGTVLCPCGCGACVVHCLVTHEGESWIDDNLTLLEQLRSRRHAWLWANRGRVKAALRAQEKGGTLDRHGRTHPTHRLDDRQWTG